MLTQIAGFDTAASKHPRRKTYGVKVGHVRVGGGAPIVVQSMTNTDTADVASTLQQTLQLAEAGSELVRWTVNVPEAAAAVPIIKKRLLDAGCNVPIIGDFHYNGHVLLVKYPDCAKALDKYRINPGNVGAGQRRDEQFSTICKVAVDNGKPVRIGVNGGSLNQELVMSKMQENTDKNLGYESEDIINQCMVLSALQSTDLAPARFNYRVSRSFRKNRTAFASWTHRSRHGHEGPDLVRRCARRAALRRHRRHHPHFAHAKTGRRSPRRSLRRVRSVAIARAARVFAQRHRLPRLRPHH